MYKELASIVHPDHNQDDPSANEKMELVNKYKNDPEMLKALAKTWGVELSGESEPEGSSNNTSQVWDIENLLDIQIENFLNALIRKVLKKYKSTNATYSHVIYKLKELIDKKILEYENSWEIKKERKHKQTWNSNKRRYKW